MIGKKIQWLLFLGLICWSGQVAKAQLSELGIRLGLAAGSPVTVPDSGAVGAPGVGQSHGLYANFRVTSQFEVRTALLWTRKRSTFGTPISGDTTVMQEILPGVEVPITTFYNGFVEGHFDNLYIELPLLFAWQPGEKGRFSVEAGGYLAYLARGDNSGLADVVIGDSFRVDNDVLFDESQWLNTVDYGAIVGTSYRLGQGFHVNLRVTAGLRSVYVKEYTQVDGNVPNIYMNAGLGWAFARKEE